MFAEKKQREAIKKLSQHLGVSEADLLKLVRLPPSTNDEVGEALGLVILSILLFPLIVILIGGLMN